jgi:hypothetical protein
MPQKILVISKFFFPDNNPRSFRVTELVEELARTGHNVTVLIPRRKEFHDAFQKEYNVKIEDLGFHFFYNTNLPVFKKMILKPLIQTGIADKLNFPDVLYYFKTKKLLKNYSNYDLLISIAIPHSIHWGVADALIKKPDITKKWIADCGDPFMGNPLFKRATFLEKYERNFCNRADFIAIPVTDAVDAYYPEYRNKIKVIPHGFNFEKDKQYISKYTPNSIPTFAYAGAFYKDRRDPRELLEFLISLDLEYKFIIYLSSSDFLSPYIKKSAGRIEIKTCIPRSNLLNELSKMDFLINFNYISSVQSPSKLIDYYLTGRPVLSINNNSAELDIIKEFLNGNYKQKHIFQDMCRYDIKNVTQQFLAL